METQPKNGSASSEKAADKMPAKISAGFGTFGGVFTPCTLTILGVIMFLRFGYIVGNSGLILVLVILVVSKTITTLTSLSLSAIATNTKVKGGGAYFLISRSLGVEFGGAIGVVFFFAQAISVAMYVIGFTEACSDAFGISASVFKVVATVVNLIVFTCVYIGAGWTIRIQYFILAILALSLVSFFVGGLLDFDFAILNSNIQASFLENESFFTMFALFFPAVTGIMAGANMSGDLKDPGRSIPSGTLWSILVTALIYAGMAVVLAATRSHETLAGNRMIVQDVSMVPLFITAGVFAATLSSALGSMMGAPRILQALARDKVFKSIWFFAKGSGEKSEPRRAVIATFLIAQAGILLADLNTIAPLITMAFMITYGMINLATFTESITKNPSYRPTFRYSHWTTALLGAIGCVVVMLLLDWLWALISIVGMAALYYVVLRKQIVSRWGDLNMGLLFERTRKNMLKLEKQLYHPKNWRPIILAMSGGGWNRSTLAVYGHWLTSGHGILSLGLVIQGDVEDRLDRIKNQEEILENFIVKEELDAFPCVVVAPYLTNGIEYMIQCQGLGALRPNTLLIGWPSEETKAESLVATISVIAAMERNIIIARFNDELEDPWEAPPGTIDVWWRGRQNGELMLLLAHVIRQNSKWRNRTIRLMRVVSEEAAYSDVLQHLQKLATDSRIEVEAEVFVSEDPIRTIQQESSHSAITFLGCFPPVEGNELDFYKRLDSLSATIPRVLFVSSTGDMKLDT